MVSPLLFSVHIDQLLERLGNSGCGLYMGKTFLGSLAYSDDSVSISCTLNDLPETVKICCRYGQEHGIKFNPGKSKCMQFSMQPEYPAAAMLLDEEQLQWTESFVYLKRVPRNDLSCGDMSVESQKASTCN